MKKQLVQFGVMMLCLFMLFSLGLGLQKTAPLSLEDAQSEQIYVRLNSGSFTLYIYNTHFITDPTTIFCFRVRSIQSTKNNFCDLTGVQNSYTCVQATGSQSGGSITNVTVLIWNSDYTLTNTVRNNQTTLSSTLISIGVSQVSININAYVQADTIYEAWAGYNIDLRNDPFSKNAFFNTFKISTQTSSDDLMAQRHPHCFQFYYLNYINYNIVFYGGVQRGTNDTMFIHVLSFFAHPNGTIATGSNLNGYIGVSLAKDHANRDMFAFITSNSTIFDMLSLYYNAPFLDQSIHVLGTSDLITLTDSALYTGGAASHYFYGGIARLYDTGDPFGDEMIRKKMNNTYCIAVGFHELNNSFAYSPLDAANKHLDYGCFTSTVALWEITSVLSAISLLFMFLI